MITKAIDLTAQAEIIEKQINDLISHCKRGNLINDNNITEILVIDKSFETYNIDWKEYEFKNILEVA